MDNFFETYLEWVIEQFNNGENINSILNSGYTANTETYYCPECSQYILASVETLICEVGEGQVCPDYSNCCINVSANKDSYLFFTELVANSNPCCTQDKFCLETNLFPESIINLLKTGIVEISSTSEIFNTNLCYLFEQLNLQGFDEKVFFEICYGILDFGIVIWCYEGVIYANSMVNYLSFLNTIS